MHVKKGDKVKVISGKDKGKSGVIVRALPKENKVVIDGVAIAKRHLKARAGKVGQIVERPRPIDASNVALVESTKSK
jgi:large subunit ribosomal protein L24